MMANKLTSSFYSWIHIDFCAWRLNILSSKSLWLLPWFLGMTANCRHRYINEGVRTDSDFTRWGSRVWKKTKDFVDNSDNSWPNDLARPSFEIFPKCALDLVIRRHVARLSDKHKNTAANIVRSRRAVYSYFIFCRPSGPRRHGVQTAKGLRTVHRENPQKSIYRGDLDIPPKISIVCDS